LLVCFYVSPTTFFSLIARKNLSIDKTVNKGSVSSSRGRNVRVIVDGDSDGKITEAGFPLPATTNSQVKCSACYISTSTDENMWIRIDLADEHFVTEVNIFTGELL